MATPPSPSPNSPHCSGGDSACQHCSKTFTTPHQLFKHLCAQHYSEYTGNQDPYYGFRSRLACHICKTTHFEQIKQLRDHYLSLHTWDDWVDHTADILHWLATRIHRDTSNKCFLCGDTYDKVSQLKIHIFSTHFTFYPNKCPHCLYTCPQKYSLKKHLRDKHGYRQDFINIDTSRYIRPEYQDVFLLRKQRTVHKLFKNILKYKMCEHIKNVHGKQDFIQDSPSENVQCKDIYSHISMLHHFEKYHSVDFTCPFCNQYVFITSTGRVDMILLIQEYQRVICDKEWQILNEHLNPPQELYSCYICRVGNFKKSELISHIFGWHLKIVRCKCKFCDMCTYSGKELQDHIRLDHHTDTIDFIDLAPWIVNESVNNSEFSLDKSSSSTTQDHGPKIGEHIENKFTCSLCSFSCATGLKMKLHMSNHRSSIPKTANQTNKRTCTLKNTPQTNDIELQWFEAEFRCEKCKVGFNTKSDISKHFLTLHKNSTHISEPVLFPSEKSSQIDQDPDILETVDHELPGFQEQNPMIEIQVDDGLEIQGFLKTSYIEEETQNFQEVEEVTKIKTREDIEFQETQPSLENYFEIPEFTMEWSGPTMCEPCGILLLDVESYAQHAFSEHPTFKYRCSACPYVCSTAKHVTIHMRKEHNIMENIEEVEVSKKKINKVHKTFLCKKCDHTSPDQKSLKEHKKIHTRSLYKCTWCSYSTTRERILKTHIFKTHKKSQKNRKVSVKSVGTNQTHDAVGPNSIISKVTLSNDIEMYVEEMFPKDSAENFNLIAIFGHETIEENSKNYEESDEPIDKDSFLKTEKNYDEPEFSQKIDSKQFHMTEEIDEDLKNVDNKEELIPASGLSTNKNIELTKFFEFIKKEDFTSDILFVFRNVTRKQN